MNCYNQTQTESSGQTHTPDATVYRPFCNATKTGPEALIVLAFYLYF